MPIAIITTDDVKTLAAKLRRIAKEITDTAIGSGRKAMYDAVAKELMDEAAALDRKIR